MKSIIRSLMDHLAAKGIPFGEIPPCVRALGLTIADNPSLSIEDLNAGIRGRGWKDFQGDEQTLTLMLLLMAETLIEADVGKRMWYEKHIQQGGRLTLRLVK